MKFYDREKEIEILRGLKGPFMVAITGRRRVGKTRLVKEAFPDCIYLFVSEEKSENMLVEEWLSSLEKRMYVPEIRRVDQLVEYLLKSSEKIIFIDEVQNLEKVNPTLLSRLQRILDENRERARMVFCGSYISMVNRLFTSSKSPLFGRMNMVIPLKELSFKTTTEICHDLGFDFENSIVLYSIFGGMPKYYELLEMIGKKRISDILEQLFFTDIAPLRYEGSLVLRNELGGEYRRYFSIMEAIASGKSTLTEIANEVGMRPQTISKYIVALKDDFALIRRSIPISIEKSGKSRSGRYFLSNNFYAFWFRFVHRNSYLLEEGNYDSVMKKTLNLLPDHTGRVFEDIVRDLVRKEGIWDRVGSWWNRRGDEIDVVAYNGSKKEILFGEVKWRNRPIGCNVVDELMVKKELVEWNKNNRKERFLIVSKSGFTKKCLERMDDGGIMHWDLRDVEKLIDS
jgi:AAA+ ATPase superfamily predicted ATPase